MSLDLLPSGTTLGNPSHLCFIPRGIPSYFAEWEKNTTLRSRTHCGGVVLVIRSAHTTLGAFR
jgi:hypothetical protein